MGFLYSIGWLIGAGLLGVQGGRAGIWIWKTYARAPSTITSRYGYGSWAVINGTPGYYATHLASQKFNLIFLSDDVANMKKEADTLQKQHAIETQVIKMDMISQKPEDYKKIVDKLKKLDVSILVNNTSKESAEDMMDKDINVIQSTLQTMMFPTLYITYYMIPKLLGRDKLGAVICHGGPDLGWNDFFARSLSLDYKNKIDFMSVVDRGDDPNVSKNAVNNLGTFRQTYSNPKEELMDTFKLNNFIRLFKRP